MKHARESRVFPVFLPTYRTASAANSIRTSQGPAALQGLSKKCREDGTRSGANQTFGGFCYFPSKYGSVRRPRREGRPVGQFLFMEQLEEARPRREERAPSGLNRITQPLSVGHALGDGTAESA